MAAPSSAELADISEASIGDLEAFLKVQQTKCRTTIESAQTKAQEAESLREQAARLAEQAAKSEKDAQSLKSSHEEHERIIRELQGAIAERKEQTATTLDTEGIQDSHSPTRASTKRPLVSNFNFGKTCSVLIVQIDTRPRFGHCSEAAETGQ